VRSAEGRPAEKPPRYYLATARAITPDPAAAEGTRPGARVPRPRASGFRIAREDSRHYASLRWVDSTPPPIFIPLPSSPRPAPEDCERG
jgi:hypothetical protein